MTLETVNTVIEILALVISSVSFGISLTILLRLKNAKVKKMSRPQVEALRKYGT